MKKFILTFTLLLSLSIGFAFAKSNDPIPKLPLRTLDQQFPGHQYAHWQYLADAELYIVRFFFNHENIFAYIDANGHINATARNIEKSQLPLAVAARIGNKYADCSILRLEELTMEGETSYLFLLDKRGTRRTVQVYLNGNSYVLHK